MPVIDISTDLIYQYQDLFYHMQVEHEMVFLQSEMDDIISCEDEQTLETHLINEHYLDLRADQLHDILHITAKIRG